VLHLPPAITPPPAALSTLSLLQNPFGISFFSGIAPCLIIAEGFHPVGVRFPPIFRFTLFFLPSSFPAEASPFFFPFQKTFIQTSMNPAPIFRFPWQRGPGGRPPSRNQEVTIRCAVPPAESVPQPVGALGPVPLTLPLQLFWLFPFLFFFFPLYSGH